MDWGHVNVLNFFFYSFFYISFGFSLYGLYNINVIN